MKKQSRKVAREDYENFNNFSILSYIILNHKKSGIELKEIFKRFKRGKFTEKEIFRSIVNLLRGLAIYSPKPHIIKLQPWVLNLKKIK